MFVILHFCFGVRFVGLVLVVVWDYTSCWQFDIMSCSELDNHASVKQVMSIYKHTRMTKVGRKPLKNRLN